MASLAQVIGAGVDDERALCKVLIHVANFPGLFIEACQEQSYP